MKGHALFDSKGQPIGLFVTAGLVNDDIGSTARLSSLLNGEWLLGPFWDHAVRDPVGQTLQSKANSLVAATKGGLVTPPFPKAG